MYLASVCCHLQITINDCQALLGWLQDQYMALFVLIVWFKLDDCTEPWFPQLNIGRAFVGRAFDTWVRSRVPCLLSCLVRPKSCPWSHLRIRATDTRDVVQTYISDFKVWRCACYLSIIFFEIRCNARRWVKAACTKVFLVQVWMRQSSYHFGANL